ncbi:MAG: endonuclease III domain-containing protein [Syntrophales bacterium]|jgi:endonuclease-3 related protein|nr:endonuclease III domain-containing protein [Syntrophales bacterium]MDY0045522.1 hypothetical protein [Syntrophales bacterium]
MTGILTGIYCAMNEKFGDLRWWPGETPFEVALGAILTQNTNWKNVEKAIERIRKENVLDEKRLYQMDRSDISELIRPAGYYNVKAERLKNFLEFLHLRYNGRMEAMVEEELWELRRQLLSVKGIGEETADSILLYGLNKPIFVVDAYTRRILANHEIIRVEWSYREIQNLFMDNLPQESAFYKQYHALFVETAKRFCVKKPKCAECPLGEIIDYETI